jgi:uncharacterized protein YodC (DUF2158 family)
MTNFKIGDVVRLKSGGPAMSITEPPAGDISGYHCVWFDEKNIYHSHYFSADVLTASGGTVGCPSAEPGHLDTTA